MEKTEKWGLNGIPCRGDQGMRLSEEKANAQCVIALNTHFFQL